MEVVILSENPDLVPIISNLELHVSSERLQQCWYFDRLFDPRFADGADLQAHKDARISSPFRKHLDHDESFGVRLTVEAIYGIRDNIPKYHDPNTVLSFARTVGKFVCSELQSVKDAARLAIDSMALSHINVQPEHFVRAAYLFNDT